MNHVNVRENTLRRQIILVGKRLAAERLIVAAQGNISARVDGNRLLITPSGWDKAALTDDCLLLIDNNGKPLGKPAGRPSSELGMHLCVYDRRPDVAACVHAHPPYATACSVAGISLAEPVLPESEVAVGPIAMADYATPSTEEVAASISELVDGHDAIILKNHGALTVANDLETALMTMQVLEHLAQVVFLARMMGQVNHLTEKQVQAIRAAVERQSK